MDKHEVLAECLSMSGIHYIVLADIISYKLLVSFCITDNFINIHIYVSKHQKPLAYTHYNSLI